MRRAQRPIAIASTLLVLSAVAVAQGADPWIVLEGGDGPGRGKHIVLVSGDEEYRSEEALPQLAKILSHAPRVQMHGAVCHRSEDGVINPNSERQHPGSRSTCDRRPDDHLHAVSRSAR